MRKTIYIAGAVTGLNYDEVREKFEGLEEKLLAQGHIVLNPVKIVEERHMQNDTWENIMQVCIRAMMFADEIHLLPCWKLSNGAMLEHDIMVRLNKTIVYL